MGGPVPRNHPQNNPYLDGAEDPNFADLLLSAFRIRVVPLLRSPAHSLVIYPGIGRFNQYELYPKIPLFRKETASESSE